VAGTEAEGGMKALSIRQPWAWAILHAGKDVENRDWKPRSPSLGQARTVMNSIMNGGLFLIHASSGMTQREYHEFYNDWHDPNGWMARCDGITTAGGLPSMEKLYRGGIVGIARLNQIVEESNSPWFFGRIGLVLKDVRKTEFMPCKGALGFFDVAPEISRKAMEAA
jgi:hypothetical protein